MGFFLLQPAVWLRRSNSQRAPGCRHPGTTDPSLPARCCVTGRGTCALGSLWIHGVDHPDHRGNPPKRLQCPLSAAERGGPTGSLVASGLGEESNFKRDPDEAEITERMTFDDTDPNPSGKYI